MKFVSFPVQITDLNCRLQLANRGFIESSPMYVMESHYSKGKYRIIDGRHRCEAAMAIGYTGKVPVIVLHHNLPMVCWACEFM
jgi:hypothetical protein